MLTVPEKKLLLFATDLAVTTLAAMAALLLTALFSAFRGEELVPQAASITGLGFLLLLSGYLNETLDIKSLQSNGILLKKWTQAWAVGVGIFAIGYFLLGVPWGESDLIGLKITRFAPLIFAALLLACIPLGRIAVAQMLGLKRSKRVCIVAGAGSAAEEFVSVNGGRNGEWDIACFVDDDPEKAGSRFEGLLVAGTLAALPDLVKRHRAADIILAINAPLEQASLDGLMKCFEKGVEVLTVAQAVERSCGRVPIQSLGSKWLPGTFWSVTDRPLIQRVAQRTSAFAVALLLILLFLPVSSTAALLLIVSQGFPVLYHQKRAGRAGRNFTLLKFRTMRNDAEKDGARWAEKNDDRATGLGRWFRRARIDEIPQLWNVLKGDMSLVGPRPERPEFVRRLEAEIPFYRARLAVKPGLTGWAQVKFGYAKGIDDAKTKLEYDLYYIKYRSFWLDFLILLQTVRVVVSGSGR